MCIGDIEIHFSQTTTLVWIGPEIKHPENVCMKLFLNETQNVEANEINCSHYVIFYIPNKLICRLIANSHVGAHVHTCTFKKKTNQT